MVDESDLSRINVQDHLVDKKDQATLFEFSKQIYGSQQTVLEFLDKGMKGILTGDLTVQLLIDIQRNISKYNHKTKTL